MTTQTTTDMSLPGHSPVQSLPSPSTARAAPPFQPQKNFHHYEVTLESSNLYDHHVVISIANAAIFSLERDRHYLSTSILRRNSVPSSNASRVMLLPEGERTAVLYSPLQHSAQPHRRGIIAEMEAKFASMNLKFNMPSFPPPTPLTPTPRTACLSPCSSFLSPDSAHTVGKSSYAAATLAQLRAKFKVSNNTVYRICAPALASSAAERGTWVGIRSLSQVAERDNPPTQDMSTKTTPTFRSPRPDGGASLDGLSPAMGDSWSSKDHTHDNNGSSIAVNDGVTNNGVYGDDDDLISGRSGSLRNGGGGSSWSGAQSPVLSNTSGPLTEATTAAARWPSHTSKQQSGASGWASASSALTRLSQLRHAESGLNMAQLAQMNGMNPFDMNILAMVNLNATGIPAKAQLLAAQTTPVAGEFGQPGLAVVGIATGRGRQREERRKRRRRPGGTERSLHRQGISWKEMVVMDEQAFEAQGVTALSARRTILKTFELVRKIGIDDPTPPPLPPPSSGGPAPSSTSTLGSSTGGGGGMPSA
ncbi:hypothetical protein V8E53_012373 [Lactarius tabidus]